MKKEIKRCDKLEGSLAGKFSTFQSQASLQKASLERLNHERDELTIKKSIYEVALAQESKSLTSRMKELKESLQRQKDQEERL
jgi:hypothetical protein